MIADNQPPSGRCHFTKGSYTLIYMGESQVNTEHIWRHHTNSIYTKAHCETVRDWLMSGRWIEVPLLELNCYTGYVFGDRVISGILWNLTSLVTPGGHTTNYTGCSEKDVQNFSMLLWVIFTKKMLHKYMPHHQELCCYDHLNVCTWV